MRDRQHNDALNGNTLDERLRAEDFLGGGDRRPADGLVGAGLVRVLARGVHEDLDIVIAAIGEMALQFFKLHGRLEARRATKIQFRHRLRRHDGLLPSPV